MVRRDTEPGIIVLNDLLSPPATCHLVPATCATCVPVVPAVTSKTGGLAKGVALLPDLTTTDAKDVFSRRKWKQVQGIRAVFWERWRKEYLPTLTKRSRWRKKARNFEVGELVLLRGDDHVKRGKWPLARITKVIPGRDNAVRSVELKTKDGDYTRPVSSLYKLEDNIADVRQGAECVTDDTDTGHPSRNLRPRANRGETE